MTGAVRDSTRATSPQQITRLPQCQVDDWIKVRDAEDPAWDGRPSELAGKVRKVVSLVASVTQRGQMAAWRIHFQDGRSVPGKCMERLATEPEVEEIIRRHK